MNRTQGFTLIELMITVAIIAILASVALPSYTAYVQRGKVAAATQLLQEHKIKMEQYYASNRKYDGAPTCQASPAIKTEDKSFTITCNPALSSGAQTFRLVAVDASSTFTYTINERNDKTSSTPWGTGTTCWILKKGATC